ncbi:hypothetical protein RND71_023054 [Anisodus tanguticus]|uniref:GB1/RHD3-type G domain-containing protein n=1 Tax=Anisodus tanguticus TaxID=243964 RepID=A0AAE1VDG4_9SOLA|nr:hypothetical protein RND71_023054 [Anisodus tanguticus]
MPKTELALMGGCMFPIIEPDPGHTKLRLAREGLEAIEKITTPIAAVAVIGPYRSGKSFTLNQLLSLSCYEVFEATNRWSSIFAGFGVGHMRDTKTKGIWVWGTPVEMDFNGVKTSVFYLDTEGFESIGKSNVYDDRIFALAAVMSSVLIYNLPETGLTRTSDNILFSYVLVIIQNSIKFRSVEAILQYTTLAGDIFCCLDQNHQLVSAPSSPSNFLASQEARSSKYLNFLGAGAPKQPQVEALPLSNKQHIIYNDLSSAPPILVYILAGQLLSHPNMVKVLAPRVIREADISRLSFAVELAEEFYGRVKGQDVAFEPAKLLWLIQHDFLQGKSVQEMVDEALRHVPNSDGDKNINQVNQIRDSLAIMGDNSTAFSLPQPHLQRTKLCDMKDAELDPLYVKKREQLKEVVASIIRPKIVQGKSLNGKEFVSFLEQILDALNKGEIPSTGSLVEVFNKGILERCLNLYNERMSSVVLPMPGESLQNAHEEHKQAAMNVFDEQHFGRHHAKKSVDKLDEEIEKVYKNSMLANEYQSSKLCEALYTRCEDKMDHLQVLRLPTMAKFNAGFIQCNQSFHSECVGPSKINYEKRMMKV